MKIINLENATEEEYKNYEVRETARAVVLDDEGKIGVIYIIGKGYIQIIGGGIDKGESIEQGLRRECLEEAGVEIEIVSKLCETKEILKFEKKIQNSYCFIVKVGGEKGKTKFTKAEIDYGFETRWLKLDELLKIHTDTSFGSLLGQYAGTRTGYILKEYNKTLI
jgi:8-oxo-dGTP pyrophosphatase MutT (NUDIX family)